MAFRIETRKEMLAAFFFYTNEEEQARAAAKIEEIMGRNRTRQLPMQIQMALRAGMQMLMGAEPTTWRLFDWFTKNMSQLLLSFEAMMNDPNNEDAQRMNEYMHGFGQIDMENPPEIDINRVPRSIMEVNAQAESLISLVENTALILKNMPDNIARPNIDGMNPDQLYAWANENSRYIASARWVELNPVYEYQNGWRMIHLTNDKDYIRAGKELNNCVRHSPPPEGTGFRGHPGVFVLIDENEKPHVALRMGGVGRNDMYVCYDAKAERGGVQVEATDYADQIKEFFRNVSPEQMFGQDYAEREWQTTQGWLAKLAFSYLH